MEANERSQCVDPPRLGAPLGKNPQSRWTGTNASASREEGTPQHALPSNSPGHARIRDLNRLQCRRHGSHQKCRELTFAGRVVTACSRKEKKSLSFTIREAGI